MIAADTSAWIDFAKGMESAGSVALDRALRDGTLVLPTPVRFEILSGPGLTPDAREAVTQLPILEVVAGFWERAADMRRAILLAGNKARGMDCLIAQNCIDHGVPLIANDVDFRHFVSAGLLLSPTP